jgi:hypothetical protein
VRSPALAHDLVPLPIPPLVAAGEDGPNSSGELQTTSGKLSANSLGSRHILIPCGYRRQ